MHRLSDEALLLAYRDGDSTAFEALFERYRGPLFNFLLRRIGDRGRAEETYQDVWLRVIERCGDFRGDARFSTWLYAIARNRCVDHRRRMALRSHASLDEGDQPLAGRVSDPSPSTERLASARLLERRIVEAVERLPDEQQEVFLLRQVQGFRFEEIAEVVRAPINTVKSRMRYALQRLRHDLSDLETGDE